MRLAKRPADVLFVLVCALVFLTFVPADCNSKGSSSISIEAKAVQYSSWVKADLIRTTSLVDVKMYCWKAIERDNGPINMRSSQSHGLYTAPLGLARYSSSLNMAYAAMFSTVYDVATQKAMRSSSRFWNRRTVKRVFLDMERASWTRRRRYIGSSYHAILGISAISSFLFIPFQITGVSQSYVQ